MPDIRIAEIVGAQEIMVEGERRLVIDAKVTGNIGRFLEELKAHGLTMFLTEDDPVCGKLGRPQEETLPCLLKKGHKGFFHKNGKLKWLACYVPDVAEAEQ